MHLRRRVPTIFNIYMLDVICCALGCVILLWQVSHQEAEEQTAAALQARENYEQASRDLTSATGEAGQFRRALAASEDKARQLADALAQSRALAAARLAEYEKALAILAQREKSLKDLRSELADVQDTQGKTESALTIKEKLNAALRTQLASTERKVTDLEKEVAARQGDVEKTLRRLEDQMALLRDSESRNKKLEGQVSDLRGEEKETKNKLTLTDLRLKLLEQELERHKKDLAEASQRFKDLLASHDTVSKQLVTSAKELGQAKAALANLEGDKTKLQG